jgi:protein-S-isoprenylcysteine O-methyltransferase Ste14
MQDVYYEQETGMRLIKGLLAPAPFLLGAAILLLAPAGLLTGVWSWPRAWTFLAGLTIVQCAGSAILALARPASFAVRQQGLIAPRERRQPLIDAIGSVAYGFCLMAWLVFIPLDVFRLHLLAAPAPALSFTGGLAALAGVVVTNLAIAQNRFAAPTIHDQGEEGQEVIQTGLYSLIRHPLYAGNLLLFAGAALWLGSYAALIATTVFLAATLARIVIEEAYLRELLPGYAAYARRVRGRLIPFLL